MDEYILVPNKEKISESGESLNVITNKTKKK